MPAADPSSAREPSLPEGPGLQLAIHDAKSPGAADEARIVEIDRFPAVVGSSAQAHIEATMAPKADTGKQSPEATRFEEALAELEGVVRKLEKGELPLEDSLAAFERGMGLVKQLSKRLEEIERRVEVLLEREDGSLAVKPLDPGDDEA